MHTKALQILGCWQTAYTPLWVPMPWVKLSNTFHTGSTYTTLSPRGLHWRCPFANNTIMDTHLCVYAHTFLNTHTRTHSHAGTRLCAHRWSNYRHFNHWTLLLWGTADIAGSGQKEEALDWFQPWLNDRCLSLDALLQLLWQMPLLFREPWKNQGYSMMCKMGLNRLNGAFFYSRE